LAVILATFVYSIICLRNFGKGLKDHRKFFIFFEKIFEPFKIKFLLSSLIVLGQQDKSQDSDTQTQSQSHRSINLV